MMVISSLVVHNGIVMVIFIIKRQFLHGNVTTVWSVSCIASPLPSLAILSVLLGVYSTSTIHLGDTSGCSLTQVDQLRGLATAEVVKLIISSNNTVFILAFTVVVVVVVPSVLLGRLGRHVLTSSAHIYIVSWYTVILGSTLSLMQWLGITLLMCATTWWVEQLIEVKILKDFPCLLLVLLRFVILTISSIMAASLLIRRDSFSNETVLLASRIKFCVFDQIFLAVVVASILASFLVFSDIVIFEFKLRTLVIIFVA